MSGTMYSVEQVADILGLHVRTVRRYVRDGRLRAMRIGKQYRITERDLRGFTGETVDETARAPHAHVSTVVHIDDVDRLTMDRIVTHLGAAAIGNSSPSTHLDLHSSYDESACRLTVFAVGDTESTAAVVSVIGALTRQHRT
jgi:excisionase family DNA binding protein